MTLRQFIALGLEFCNSLSTHHSIEERYFFPLLARRMPAFREELELLAQHKQIHAGLDKFEAYLNECKSGENELRLYRMKELMDGFGTVLWQHLDDEVKELGAENMRKYWTLEELRAFPM
jgi:hemerythrin-like domain-containing protein